MIPAYKEEITITIVENPAQSTSLEQKVNYLEERVRQLHETVQYMERERGRLKGEIDTMKNQLNKR